MSLSELELEVPEPDDSLSFSGLLREMADAADSRPERTRYILLAAIAEELGEGVGLAGLKVAAVTARAGVAHGTFYRYFEDIPAGAQALVEAFSSFLRQRLFGERFGSPGSRESIRATNLAYARLFAENAELMRCLFALRSGDGDFARIQGEIDQDRYQRMALTLALRRSAATGDRLGPGEALATAYALGGMADDFLSRIHLRREPALAHLADDHGAVADLLTELWCRGAYGAVSS